MANTELNARLAKWRGWTHCGDDHEPPCERGGWISPAGYWQKDCPAYDTDPAAALELLGWLAEKPRGWSYIVGWDQADGHVRFCRLWQHVDPPGPDGKRLNVITTHAATETAAIAEVAEAVLDLEEGDDD